MKSSPVNRALSYLRYSLEKLARARAIVATFNQKLADDIDLQILKLNRIYDRLLDLDGKDR